MVFNGNAFQAVNRTANDTPCMPLHQPATTGPSFNLMPELFQAISQSTTSSQSSETCALQEEASLNSHDEPTMTYPLSPALLSLRNSASASPPPVQAIPMTGWIPGTSTPVQLRMLSPGEMAGGAPSTSARTQSTQTPGVGVGVPARGRSPLSSFFPLYSTAQGAQAATAARDPADVSRDRSYLAQDVSGSHGRESGRPTRERSRSPEAGRQLRLPGAFTTFGRLMQSQARTAQVPHANSTGSQPQPHLPVVLSMLQTNSPPVGTRLRQGRVAVAGSSGTSQVQALSSST
jgi:hypothetical protein